MSFYRRAISPLRPAMLGLFALMVLWSATVVAAANTPITSTDALIKMRIGVLQGSAYDVYAAQNFKQAKLLRYNAQADVVTALLAGKIDGGISDAASLNALLAEQPAVRRFGDSIFDSPSGAGFRKDSTDLRARFDAFLAQSRANGTLDDLEHRWRVEGQRTLPDIPFTGDEPTLKVGNSIIGLPSVTYVDNQLVGSEVELAMRFAKAIGHRPVFVTVDWGALIPSLVSGKIDVVISDMFITPEREERIAFSKPYRREGTFFFVLSSRLPVAANAAGDAPNLMGANASTGQGEQMSGSDNVGANAGSATPMQTTASTVETPTFIKSLQTSFYSNIIREDRWKLILGGLWVTLIISIGSCVFGTALGVLVCAMRMSPLAAFRWPARGFIDLLRGIPAVVLLMLIFYVLFGSVNINPVLVSIFAFGLMFAAYTAEIFRAGLSGIDRGQSEAAISLGFTRLGMFRHIILPQLVQRILPVYKGEFISMVKNTSIVGYVAVQDLTKVGDIIRSRTFDAFFPLIMITLIYLGVIWLLGQALTALERRTDPERRRRRVAS